MRQGYDRPRTDLAVVEGSGHGARGDLVEHLRRELAGERVLLARVEAPDSGTGRPPPPPRGRSDGFGRGAAWPERGERPERPVPRERAERDDRPQTTSSAASSRSRYGRQASRSSGVGLFPGGAHRLTAATYAPRSSSPSSRATDVGWFASPHAMQRREQEVARPVAGEDPAGAVAAVRRRRQADDQDPRPGIAEPGTGRPQYVWSANARDLLRRDLLAPCDEPGTGATDDDLGVDLGERGHPLSIGRG